LDRRHNREQTHHTGALTGSIPVSRTSITAVQSVFLAGFGGASGVSRK
jgi:hypothetical protein